MIEKIHSTRCGEIHYYIVTIQYLHSYENKSMQNHLR